MFIPKGGITLYTFESSNVNNLQQVGKDQSRHKVIFSGEIQELCGVRYQDNYLYVPTSTIYMLMGI